MELREHKLQPVRGRTTHVRRCRGRLNGPQCLGLPGRCARAAPVYWDGGWPIPRDRALSTTGLPGSRVKVPALVWPELSCCASSGRAWRLWTVRHSQGVRRANELPATASSEPPPKSPTPLTAFGRVGRVKLSSSLVDERGGDFRCECVYVADRCGAVDTRVHPSVGGTFEGVQPTGLLDHLVAVEPGRRLLKRDVTTPWRVAVQLHREGADAVKRVAERWYLSPDVTVHEVDAGRLRGRLFVPAAHHGRVPAVIDLFGSLPGCVDFRAALLASHGFLAYALPNYGYRDMPRSFAQAALGPKPTRDLSLILSLTTHHSPFTLTHTLTLALTAPLTNCNLAMGMPVTPPAAAAFVPPPCRRGGFLALRDARLLLPRACCSLGAARSGAGGGCMFL